MESTAGYLYLLINRSMPGLVKIGRTSRAPVDRISELSSATGVPTPFELVYDVLVPDAAAAERAIHDALSTQGHRTSPNREFFEAPIHEVVKMMIRVREAADSSSVQASLLAAETSDSDDLLDMIEERDDLFDEAARIVIQHNEGTTSLLQRRLRVGYGRAARLIDQLHNAGILGPPDGSNPRAVLKSQDEGVIKHRTPPRTSWFGR